MSNDKPKTFFNQQEPIIKQDPHGSILFFLFVCVCLCLVACGILVPPPGIESKIQAPCSGSAES